MIGIHDDTNTRLAVTFPDITLNNPADATDDTFEINNISTVGQYDQAIDSSPADNGAIVSPARRVLYVVRIDGTIRAPTLAKLFDKKVLLSGALDPALAVRKYPATGGFVDMDFSVPTTDTTEYPSGLVASRYRVRSRGAVIPLDSTYQGTASFFTIELLLKDPRRVSQTEESELAGGTIINKGNAPAAVRHSIAMTGAGSSAFTATRTGDLTGAKSLVLNLSGRANGETVTVDHTTRTIEVNGVSTPNLYVSGDFWDMDPGSNVLTGSGLTNASRTAFWRRSWVA